MNYTNREWTADIGPFRCDQCGRFVGLADLDSGAASHRLVLPDSAYTVETFETLCPNHAKES